MFNDCQRLRAIFLAFLASLVFVSTARTQDISSGLPGSFDPSASSILKQNIIRVSREPEDSVLTRDGLIDFSRTRLMNPVGLIPTPDRRSYDRTTNFHRMFAGAFVITLEDAQARAVSAQTVILAGNMVDAARYHRKAIQSDYFPKISATFVNIHYNKFMGDTFQLFARRPLIPTVTRAVPLLAKDETIVLTTVTQPLTPLFKVHQVVRIARADERIARAKANAMATQLTAEVERVYFELLIAQRRQKEAEANSEIAERKLEIASSANAMSISPTGMTERQAVFMEAKKTLLAASDRVTELTNALIDLTGFPDNAHFVLVPPAPLVETSSIMQNPQPGAQKPQPVIAYNYEIVEAEEAVVKAQAAHRLAKLEYVPDVAIFGGYLFQTAIPALPDDFSFIGVIATYNLFDFGKRERTVKERRAQVSMAKANLELVRAKVSAGAQKTAMDLDRTRRILELTQQVVSMQRDSMPRDQTPGPEARAALAKAEAEMFQAEVDYRTAYAQMKRVTGEE